MYHKYHNVNQFFYQYKYLKQKSKNSMVITVTKNGLFLTTIEDSQAINDYSYGYDTIRTDYLRKRLGYIYVYISKQGE